MVNVFIGYDAMQNLAYEVCKHSILERSKDVHIIPLKKPVLRGYSRSPDPLASTDFTYTRFMVPYLNNYKDWALFIDCDIIAQTDIRELFDLKNDKYTVMVTKHDYEPNSEIKMGNKVQTNYPRKNWSSVMLFNCAKCTNLTVDDVNHQTGKYLHQFEWVDDDNIGGLPREWNWLAGYYKNGDPKLIHYTDGGPWLEKYKHCAYSREWYIEWERRLKN